MSGSLVQVQHDSFDYWGVEQLVAQQFLMLSVAGSSPATPVFNSYESKTALKLSFKDILWVV